MSDRDTHEPSSFTGTLRRWWRSCCAIIVLCAALCVVAWNQVAPSYSCEAMLVLVSPIGGPTESRGETRTATNPLLNFDASLSTSALIVVQTLGSVDVKTELGADPVSGSDLTVSDGSILNPNDFQVVRPFVILESNSRDRQIASTIVGRAVERVRTELDDRQRSLDAPVATFIRVETVVAPTDPVINRKDQWFAVVAVGVVVLALGLGLIFTLDSFTGKDGRGPSSSEDEFPDPATRSLPTSRPGPLVGPSGRSTRVSRGPAHASDRSL